jgi:hypothetical protein
VLITYLRGDADARRVAGEIAAGGGSAETLRLDVRPDAPDFPADRLLAWAPSHGYYFATPFITASTEGAFSRDLFASFCDYYVTGFQRVAVHLINVGARRLFYPSSVYIDELPPGLAEYAAAKAAGETLCSELEKTHRGVLCYKPRLPRMATDQTVSRLVALPSADPADVMVEHLRAFRGI